MNREQLTFIDRWLKTEQAEGERHVPSLLELPTSAWRTAMDRDRDLRRFGTLNLIIDAVRSDLFTNPARARERAAIVVDYAPNVEAPAEQLVVGLHGRALKEYANALRYVGEHKDGLDAARHSQAVYAVAGSFASEQSKAQLVEALILRELGKLDDVIRIARGCATVFLDYGDATAYVHARMTEALALSDAKRHREAFSILTETAVDAEKRDDRHTLAICLHNMAECARILGDRKAAKDFDARALAHFEKLGSVVDRPRTRWTYALSLADEGRVHAAISELYTGRAELLALGMNAAAADFGLEIARLRFEQGEDITEACCELVKTFTDAGMLQSAIEALAYLREQVRRGDGAIPAVIAYVRNFIAESEKAPRLKFVPLPDHERGWTE